MLCTDTDHVNTLSTIKKENKIKNGALLRKCSTSLIR